MYLIHLFQILQLCVPTFIFILVFVFCNVQEVFFILIVFNSISLFMDVVVSNLCLRVLIFKISFFFLSSCYFLQSQFFLFLALCFIFISHSKFSWDLGLQGYFHFIRISDCMNTYTCPAIYQASIFDSLSVFQKFIKISQPLNIYSYFICLCGLNTIVIPLLPSWGFRI